MITKESMPDSRTQLYGGQTIPFLDGFRVSLETAERFIKSRTEVIDHILDAWENLLRAVKETPEAKKLKEVVSVFSVWLGSYQDLLTDFNERFNERIEDLEKDLLLLKF